MLQEIVCSFTTMRHTGQYQVSCPGVFTPLLMLTILIPAGMAIAATTSAKQNSAPPKATAVVADPYSDAVDPDSVDARKRILRAPKFDINKVRDPFVSYLDKMTERERQLQELLRQKQEEARRRIDSRVKEPLESFDLSALKFVATFIMGDRKVAMVEDTSGIAYTVKEGNYMGRNNGRIISIEDDKLVLLEKRIDPAGDIVDSKQVLYLKKE